jgi:hypothetical protein
MEVWAYEIADVALHCWHAVQLSRQMIETESGHIYSRFKHPAGSPAEGIGLSGK